MTQTVARAGWGLPAPELGLGLATIAAYFAIRTLALPEPVPTAWLVFAVVLTLGSPLGGLTILAAIGPFTEALTDDRRITAVPFLLAALGPGVVLRLIVTRPLPRPNWPVILALLLMAGTALGVLNSYLSYGPERGQLAAEMWLPGIGGAMAVLLAAAWVAWRGNVAPLFIAVASTAMAAFMALINLETNGYLRTSTAIGWLLRQEAAGGRLTGVIPAANAAAVIFLLGFVGCVALAMLVPRRWWVRLPLLLSGAVVLYAIWLTGSRSALLGVVVAVTIVAFAWHRRIGLAVGAAVIGAILVLIVTGSVRDVPVAADASRIDAWTSTIRLWLDHPILGAGFRSYEWLHPDVGSPFLNAPHSEWLRLFGEEGTLVGLIGLSFALVTPIVLLRAGSWIAVTSAAVAAGVFVAACFNNPFIYTQVNVAAFTIIGIGLGLVLRERDGVRGTTA